MMSLVYSHWLAGWAVMSLVNSHWPAGWYVMSLVNPISCRMVCDVLGKFPLAYRMVCDVLVFSIGLQNRI